MNLNALGSTVEASILSFIFPKAVLATIETPSHGIFLQNERVLIAKLIPALIQAVIRIFPRNMLRPADSTGIIRSFAKDFRSTGTFACLTAMDPDMESPPSNSIGLNFSVFKKKESNSIISEN